MTREEVKIIISVIERELMKLCDDADYVNSPKELNKLQIIEEFSERNRKALFEALDKNKSVSDYTKKIIFDSFDDAIQMAGSYKDIDKVESALVIIHGFVMTMTNPYANSSQIFDVCKNLKHDVRLIR